MRGISSTVLVSCSLLAACVGGVTSGGSSKPPAAGADAAPAPSSETDFDRAMMEIATTYHTFSKIDRKPYMSTTGAFDINVYVHGDAQGYRAVHPDSTAMTPPIAVGTVIVREVLAADGSVSKLTLMAKGPSGYDPTFGDWWFGEADPQGMPLVVDGVVRLGRLDDCHSCHMPRAPEDYLFGVPKVDQTSH
jgi:hypothetical protein